MPRQLLIPLLLLTVLPLAGLGWFGWHNLQNQQQQQAQQLRQLATAQSESIDQRIQALLNQLANFITDEMTSGPLSQPPLRNKQGQPTVSYKQIRSWKRQQLYVPQVIVLANNGSRVFPPENGAISNAESEFLGRSKILWQERDLLYSTATESQPVANSRSFRSAPSKSIKNSKTPARSGWYAWFVDQRLQLLFWREDAQQQIWGFEIGMERFLADLIAELPSSDPQQSLAAELRNSRGRTIYRWGNSEQIFTTDNSNQTKAQLHRQSLTAPLSSWQLELRLAEGANFGWQRWQWLLWLCLAAVLFIAVARYLWSAQKQQLELAAERVSFVNQVSHELKTPLTNIRMYAELLQGKLSDSPAPIPRYLQVVVGETERLSRLIANVLSFGRSGRGQLSISTQAVNMEELLTNILERYRPALEEKSITTDLQIELDQPVELDPDAFEQVLNNLLSNVEKYATSSNAQPHVIIQASQKKELLRVCVSDNGPGIPNSEKERVFAPFYRLSNQVSDGVSGTGIGLGLARDLCRLHGGDLLLLESAMGACFEIRLPMTQKGK